MEEDRPSPDSLVCRCMGLGINLRRGSSPSADQRASVAWASVAWASVAWAEPAEPCLCSVPGMYVGGSRDTSP
jgi:hypothetical protein